MSISPIGGNKAIPSIIIILGTFLIGEVEFFQIVQENIFGNILDAGDCSTIIKTFFWFVLFGCSMGDDFGSSGSTFGISGGSVMIALDPEMEVSSSIYHLVVH